MAAGQPVPRPGRVVQAVGIVLAAGAGTRYGGPKALARTPSGEPWLRLACSALRAGGCSDVIAVLGAQAAEAVPLVPSWAVPVVAAGWSRGVSASLRAGLAAATATAADVAVVTLVDLPGLRPEAVSRVLRAALGEWPGAGPGAGEAPGLRSAGRPAEPPGLRSAGRPAEAPGAGAGDVVGPDDARRALGRAVYAGRPGHPVLLGRAHWADVSAAVTGDTGAGPYLRAHGAVDVDCTDLGGGDDVDVPAP